MGGCLKKGSKNCFSLIKYGFCSSNALYSESLSFRMFIFILTPFHTWDCYYFVLNLRLVLPIKLFFITLVFSLLKMKKKLCHMSLFLCLSGKSCQKHEVPKKIKRRGDHIRGTKVCLSGRCNLQERILILKIGIYFA